MSVIYYSKLRYKYRINDTFFNTYLLRTAKYLDFKDWKRLLKLNSNSLEETFPQILTLKKDMTKGRTIVNIDQLPDNSLNPYWLVE